MFRNVDSENNNWYPSISISRDSGIRAKR